jgi:hypothetical protein
MQEIDANDYSAQVFQRVLSVAVVIWGRVKGAAVL